MLNQIKRIKSSIRVKLTFMLTGVVLLIILLLWIMNLTFYPMYYQTLKTNQFVNTYKTVKLYYQYTHKGIFGNGIFQQDFEQEELSAICAKEQVNIYVFQAGNFGGLMYPIMYYPNDSTKGSRKLISERFEQFTSGKGKQDIDKIISNAHYEIYQCRDESTDSDFIELFATLDKEQQVYLFIRSNIESMQQGINNTNTFLTWIGMITGIIGIIMMYFFSKSFTNPILQLAEIAKRMSRLDFQVKYKGKGQDEIGELGNSINSLSDKLETTITELKIANNELKIDNEHKTQIDEMRKEFLSNVSHELKTPIALIQGYAEGLKENINDDEESRNFYCEVIMDEAQKMNKMVKKLLTLNQIEFGNNFVQMERFDLTQMMMSVLNSTKILFEQKEVTLDFIYQEPIYVKSDEYMIEEVFTNFISNALNHIAGEKVIKVEVEDVKDVLRVKVFNTGLPIPEEELDKIWIKFYKVDKARTREYGGNGIGLSIVSAIMKSLNHSYGVYNLKNGVCFWFELDKDKETS